MNSKNLPSKSSSWSRCFALSASGLLLSTVSVAATTTNVLVGDIYFSPPTVQIKPGDAVEWDWVGALVHSSMSLSTPVLWDSGLHTHGYIFSHTFPSTGNFPYWCAVHAFQQLGTVIVSTNVPPTVAITSPTNGSIFAAPWAGTILATNSASGATVRQVAFFAGSALLGTVTNPPPTASFPAPNLPAGSYSLRAAVTDSTGVTNNSVIIRVNVIVATPIALSSSQWQSPSRFQFSYSANPGLIYIVRRAEALPTWLNLATNKATLSSITFVDANATNSVNFYSVELFRNF